jgi:hypothetical protein
MDEGKCDKKNDSEKWTSVMKKWAEQSCRQKQWMIQTKKREEGRISLWSKINIS